MLHQSNSYPGNKIGRTTIQWSLDAANIIRNTFFFFLKRSLKTQKREFLPLSQTQKRVPLPTSQINYSYPELTYNAADSLKHLMKKATNHMFRLNRKEEDTMSC